MKYLKFFLVIFFFSISAVFYGGQSILITTVNDTLKNHEYYTNLDNQFILRFYTLYKSNNLNLSKDENTLRYRPNGVFSIGVGFNYKFIGLGISYGAPLSSQSKAKKGNTQRLDIQASVISTAIGLDGFLQIYKGYYISNPYDFTEWDKSNYPLLPDMQVITFGVNAFYIFNNKKFSFRAAFIGNQVQNRSAGSLTTGLFGTFDQVRTNNGLMPDALIDSTQNEFDLRSFEAITVGLSAGYMYTFVFNKGFFLSLAAVPGIGYRHYNLVTIDNSKSNKDQLALQLLGRIAMGFTKSRYYINLNTVFNVRNYNYRSYNLEMSTEQLRLTFGIRFQTQASNKRNQFHP